MKRNPFNVPRTFGGKKYSYAGFYSAADLKKEKPWFKMNGYLVRAVPHPQGSGYNVYVRHKRPGD